MMERIEQESNPEMFSAIENLIRRINSQRGQIKNKELLELCKPLTNSCLEVRDLHIFHELAETSLNKLLKTNYAKDLLFSIVPAKNVKEIIKPLTQILPTQTWKSPQQIKFQQYSTPPAIAYLLTYILNLKPAESILEPSAGTGSLAIWAEAIGTKVLTNEIDQRRRDLLHHLGFEPTDFNAEFINDFLTPEITVDVLLMNPPFSANGGRTKNSSIYGFRHVSSALERLRKGGRFGVILGESGGLETKTGREFWHKLLDRFEIKFNLKLSGKEYYKNGSAT